jgi:hypothetical protein
MDGQRFDELTKKLAATVSRRGLLRTLAGGVAAAGAALTHRGASAAPNACAVGCAGLPGPQKAACTQACKRCGGDFSRVCAQFGPFGPTGFTCCPEGTICDEFTGACLEVTICPTGEPAESCAAGITTDCGEGGACALVVNVDGGCACVERVCSFTACTTGADCDSGLCVDIPGCCGEPNPFCGTPCGAAGTTARPNGAGDWQR